MHELSICHGIMRIIQEQSVMQDFSNVETVHLEIGPFAGVEIHALRFGFEVATKGSIAQGSKLEITQVPVDAFCQSCEKSVIVQQRFDACPFCGEYQVEIKGGDELRIKDLEVS